MPVQKKRKPEKAKTKKETSVKVVGKKPKPAPKPALEEAEGEATELFSLLSELLKENAELKAKAFASTPQPLQEAPDPQLATISAPPGFKTLTPEDTPMMFDGRPVLNNEYNWENFMSKVTTHDMCIQRLTQDVDTMKVQIGSLIGRLR